MLYLHRVKTSKACTGERWVNSFETTRGMGNVVDRFGELARCFAPSAEGMYIHTYIFDKRSAPTSSECICFHYRVVCILQHTTRVRTLKVCRFHGG